MSEGEVEVEGVGHGRRRLRRRISTSFDLEAAAAPTAMAVMRVASAFLLSKNALFSPKKSKTKNKKCIFVEKVRASVTEDVTDAITPFEV